MPEENSEDKQTANPARGEADRRMLERS